MTYCRNCKAELKEDALFCSKCGAPAGQRAVETLRRRQPRSFSPIAIASIAGIAAVAIIVLVALAFLSGGLPLGALLV
jgi:uncharacterized membrane protein YvbJ